MLSNSGIRYRYKDQGWGNRKGQVLVYKVSDAGVETLVQCTSLVESARALSVCVVCVCVCVGVWGVWSPPTPARRERAKGVTN